MSQPPLRGPRPASFLLLRFGVILWIFHTSSCKRSDPPQPDSAQARSAPAAAVVPPSAAPAVPSAAQPEAPSATPPKRKADGPVPARLLPWAGSTEDRPTDIFVIEGAIMATDGRRVGKLDGDKIEWIGKIPNTGDNVVEGQQMVTAVHGVWPDRVDAFTNNSGRAHFPAYYPIKGGGAATSIGQSGEQGEILGIGYTAESTLLAYRKLSGDFLVPMRGAKQFFPRKSGKDAGCNEDTPLALRPDNFTSTRGGQLVALGKRCDGKMAVEIWDAPAKPSRFVELPANSDLYQNHALLRGAGPRELWFFSGKGDLVYRYEDGVFTPTTPLGASIQRVFVSLEGQLHAFDGRVIYRLEGQRWVGLYQFLWSTRIYRFAAQGDTIWIGTDRLVEGDSFELTEQCASPFVDLYEVSGSATASFTFPSTRKALSSFAEVDQLSLVDFYGGDARRLGIIARSKAQAEAVVAHVKATMKDEKPRGICFKPEKPRVIEITKK